MNGVDSCDQRREAFDARLFSNRNWISLYQFLLDVCLVNTVAIGRMGGWIAPKTTTAHARAGIAQEILATARKEMNLESVTLTSENERPVYVTRGTSAAPQSRLSLKPHLPTYESVARRCYVCRYRCRLDSSKETSHRSHLKCTECNVYLCLSGKRNCYATFHSAEFA